MSKHSWKDIEEKLGQNRPDPGMKPADEFWPDFKAQGKPRQQANWRADTGEKAEILCL